MHAYTYMYLRVCVRMCVSVRVCTYTIYDVGGVLGIRLLLMCTCMYMYMFMYTCMYIHMCVCVCVYVCVSARARAHTLQSIELAYLVFGFFSCVRVYLYVCMHVYTYAFVCVCVYVRVSAGACTHTTKCRTCVFGIRFLFIKSQLGDHKDDRYCSSGTCQHRGVLCVCVCMTHLS